MQTIEIDPDNVYCLILKRQELEDLIRVVEWFAVTEADLHRQVKWKFLLDDLIEVRKQEL
jgi:hypothetical protein